MPVSGCTAAAAVETVEQGPYECEPDAAQRAGLVAFVEACRTVAEGAGAGPDQDRTELKSGAWAGLSSTHEAKETTVDHIGVGSEDGTREVGRLVQPGDHKASSDRYRNFLRGNATVSNRESFLPVATELGTHLGRFLRNDGAKGQGLASRFRIEGVLKTTNST